MPGARLHLTVLVTAAAIAPSHFLFIQVYARAKVVCQTKKLPFFLLPCSYLADHRSMTKAAFAHFACVSILGCTKYIDT